MGYGYPFWVVYAPLAYFAAEVFHLLGVGFTASIKIVIALSTLFGGWGMYALLRRWWGRNPIGRGAALVGGLIYVYAPYHLLTVYVRAAFAEYVAMAWFPWVLLAFDDVVERGGLRRIALAALALGALFLTHSATLMVFTAFLAFYLLFALARKVIQQRRQQESWRQVLLTVARVAAAGLLAIGLAAIFLLPLLAEQGYVQQADWLADNYLYQKHFVWPNQFTDPMWGYGFSDDPTGPNDGMSFQLGIVGVVLALTAAVVGLRRRSHRRGQTAFFVAGLLAVLLLMMPVARPIWDTIGPAALIQFPWRLLSVASLCLAMLAGAAVGNLLGAGDWGLGTGAGDWGLGRLDGIGAGLSGWTGKPVSGGACAGVGGGAGQSGFHGAAVHQHRAYRRERPVHHAFRAGVSRHDRPHGRGAGTVYRIAAAAAVSGW